MSDLPADPIAPGGLEHYASRLRNGAVSAVEATAQYLKRIRLLDRRLNAFEWVDDDGAMKAAHAIDAQLAAGNDLGPLMGVPVAIKDVFAVQGMPTTAGSYIDVSDLIGTEGSFMQRLRGAGCIILGKTRTVEFALGAARHTRGTPRNPVDLDVHRSPGGSSSGSAVAVAAGLCGFSVGTDTGGSIRIPAAFCGVFGLKTTKGRWQTDGVFPTAPGMDTIGLLTATASDAAIVFGALEGEPPLAPPCISTLRLARPARPFFEELDLEVANAIAIALQNMKNAACQIIPMEWPEAVEASREFPILVPTEFLETFTRERFMATRALMEPTVAARAASALDVEAAQIVRLKHRRQELIAQMTSRWADFDAIVSPTVKMLPVPTQDLDRDDFEHEYHRRVAANTRPANVLDLCAVTIPIRDGSNTLPTGLQIICEGSSEAKALSIARTLETLLGRVSGADVSAFLV